MVVRGPGDASPLLRDVERDKLGRRDSQHSWVNDNKIVCIYMLRYQVSNSFKLRLAVVAL